MGEYSTLYMSGYPVISSKNSYYQDIVSYLFTPSDYIEVEVPKNSRKYSIYSDPDESEEGTELFEGFLTSAKVCIDRLELLGATHDKAKKDYEEARAKKIQEWEDSEYKYERPDLPSYEIYLQEVKQIIQKKIRIPYSERPVEPSFQNMLIEDEFIIGEQTTYLWLWSLLNSVERESIVEYEFTHVLGWLFNHPLDNLEIEKIIILTEGKTDTEFIQACISIFYPHLSDYFHFMDFTSSKYEANASRLVHTIKSFVGSGIKNKIIALFDNDSAAMKEIKQLSKVTIPHNIKILQYPSIELANNYPTIGPSGVLEMNVNGLAGSIEMYLGRDCLSDPKGLIPVQWTGYVESINQYQGSILKKKQVQDQFRDKVKLAKKGFANKTDWQELLTIVKLLRTVWQ